MYIDSYLKDRKNNFDIIRLFAAILVIYSHSYPLLLGNENNEPLMIVTRGQMTLGGFAVSIFFILSGFLILMSYDRKRSLRQYFVARILRIFPALILMLFLTVFVMGPIFSEISVIEYFSKLETYTYFFRNVTLFINQYSLPGVFVYNIYPNAVNGSLWTLSYEFLFYCSIPILYRMSLLSKKNNTYFFISITVLNIVMMIANNFNLYPTGFIYNYIFNATYLFNYFLAGCLFYIYRDVICFTKKKLYVSTILLLIFIIIGLPKIALTIFGAYILFYLSFFAKRIYSNCSKYGDFSYGIYIYAFPIQQMLSSIGFSSMNLLINFLVVLIVTLILSFISWHLVEKKALAYKI